MRLRLQRHEVACKFTAYLQWIVKDYIPGGKKRHGAQNTDVADPGADKQTLEDDVDDSPAATSPQSADAAWIQHYVAKKPPFTMPLTTINLKFKVHRFAETLEKFLRKSESLHPLLHRAIENARYQVFKQFTATIPVPPQVATEPFIRDVICARAGEPGSTVLAKADLSIDDDPSIRWWDINGKIEMFNPLYGTHETSQNFMPHR